MKFLEVKELFPKYRYPETFSAEFLRLSPIQRARNLKTLYSEVFELTSTCRQFDDPTSGFIAKSRNRVNSQGEQAFLEDFSKFALNCKALFSSAIKMFSNEEIELIFYRHRRTRNTLENMLHRLYFTNDSYFSGLERLETTQAITPKWREILRQYRK